MTTDDIIRMAREAGAFAIGDFVEAGEIDILRFANLVAAAEREACAKLCEDHSQVYSNLPKIYPAHAGWAACIDLRDAIKARGQE